MNAIVLPAGTTHVRLEELEELIADALFPYTGPDDARLRAGYALANIGDELDMEARAGKLLLRDGLTLGPYQVRMGEKIVNALVAVDDLRDYADRHRKLTVIVEPSENVSEKKSASSELESLLSSPATSTEIPSTPMVTGTASVGVINKSKPTQGERKSDKTLAFEAEVIRLLNKFWNERNKGTEPTKGDLCELVFKEILRGPVRGARKTTQGMVTDAAKSWRHPILLPAYVPPKAFKEKRHPFKGDK